ncbi:hypothetical protein RRG08_023980 [Elysia crispata]|uniref:Uncharacterized protein n=1 Tax=Elysia crispata TaxID=231223 RepID=A0AAE0YMA7_9GAST|nr:hypothetical protein RRG08_023980 [Elysia crispata]
MRTLHEAKSAQIRGIRRPPWGPEGGRKVDVEECSVMGVGGMMIWSQRRAVLENKVVRVKGWRDGPIELRPLANDFRKHWTQVSLSAAVSRTPQLLGYRGTNCGDFLTGPGALFAQGRYSTTLISLHSPL